MEHHVTYYFAGIIVAETSSKKLNERDPEEARRAAPRGAYAFRLWDCEEAPDLGEEFVVTPKPKNHSGYYFLGGEVMSLATIEATVSDPKILLTNMRSNHPETDHAIRCSSGNWQPFLPGDILLAPQEAS